MPILLSNKKIYLRSNEIRNLIKPLSRNGNSVSCKISTTQKGAITFGTFGGSAPISSNYKDWHFKTHKTKFNASYFEVWLEKGVEFCLEKAYFKLMVNENNINKEILSLHIDPSETINKYKTGPHLHVKTTNDFVSKAHISLNLSNLNQVINSFDEFKKAYRHAITMINEEFL